MTRTGSRLNRSHGLCLSVTRLEGGGGRYRYLAQCRKRARPAACFTRRRGAVTRQLVDLSSASRSHRTALRLVMSSATDGSSSPWEDPIAHCGVLTLQASLRRSASAV